MLCMVVLLVAMTTGVMGCYQKDPDPIEVPSGTSEVEATPIPTVNRQAELADAKSRNPDAVAWLYIPGAEVDDPVMQAEDNGFYLNRDELREYSTWGCYYADCRNHLSGRDALDTNTVIYGHSANDCDPDGVRFTKLHRYMDADFVKENPYGTPTRPSSAGNSSRRCRKFSIRPPAAPRHGRSKPSRRIFSKARCSAPIAAAVCTGRETSARSPTMCTSTIV